MLVLTAACGSKKTSAPPPHSQVVPKVSQEDIAKCLREPVTLRAANGYHVLASGETLYRVSRIYDTTVDELIEINNIQDYTDIPTGTRLRVPGVAGVAEPSSLIWPLPGSISSGYGKRGRRFHWGIDIPAPSGTPIRAPADGLVLVSTNGGKGFTGYGRVVVIAHGNGISTLYAHNRSNEVKAGSCIRAGEVLGKVGATGNATGNHLHFEIRKNGKPVNPLDYLP